MPPIPRYIEIPATFDRDMEESNISCSSVACQETGVKHYRTSKVPSRWDTSAQEGHSYGIPKPTRTMSSDYSQQPHIPVRIPQMPFQDVNDDEEGLDYDLGHERWCAIPKPKKTPRSFSHARSEIILSGQDDEKSPRGVEEYTGSIPDVETTVCNRKHIQRRRVNWIDRSWKAAPYSKTSDAGSTGSESQSTGSFIDTSSVKQRQSTPAA